MILTFGSIRIDTKGLPRPLVVNVARPLSERAPLSVYIYLERSERAAVEKWAKRLDVPVLDRLRPVYEGDPLPREIEAVLEADGYRVCVYVRAAAEAPKTRAAVAS